MSVCQTPEIRSQTLTPQPRTVIARRTSQQAKNANDKPTSQRTPNTPSPSLHRHHTRQHPTQHHTIHHQRNPTQPLPPSSPKQPTQRILPTSRPQKPSSPTRNYPPPMLPRPNTMLGIPTKSHPMAKRLARIPQNTPQNRPNNHQKPIIYPISESRLLDRRRRARAGRTARQAHAGIRSRTGQRHAEHVRRRV